jgi:hypothetical protein
MNTTSNSEWRFSKVLSANDLGLTGSHQAGVLVPRNSPIHQFLPELAVEMRNPSVPISWWCPQIECEIISRFVYYNSKTNGTGTRNEFRITRLGALFRELRPAPGNRLVFSFNAHGSSERVLLVEFSETSTTISSTEHKWTIEEIPFAEQG